MEPITNVIDFAIERRKRGPRFTGEMMQILEVSRDLICLCRGGAITAINGAGVRILGGRTTEQMIGRRLAEFLIPEYGQVLELFLSGMASEDRGVPTRIVGLDRVVRDIELQVFRAREIAPDATVVTGRDLSKEGKLAGSAHQSDTRFHLLVENSFNLVCHVVAGSIRYINKAGLGLLGATEAEQVIGQRLEDIVHPDYAGLIEEVAREEAAVPMRLRHRDGSVFDALVRVTALPSAGLGAELMVEARDITSHNRAVSALRHANETLEMRVAARTRELAEQRARAEEMTLVAEAARRFSDSLIDTIPSPVWFKDALGRVQTSNRAFRALFGDTDPSTLLPLEETVTDAELMAGACDQAAYEASILPPGGGRLDAMVLKSSYVDEEKRPVGIIGVLTDISERKAMERELRRLATIDPLTGAFNRRHFMATAATEVERAQRYGNPLSLMMLDVDFFKRINDRHGHALGDEALRRMVDCMRQSLRDIDVIGRLGGEEFAVLLPETGPAGARITAERLRAQIAALRIPLDDGQNLAFTVSIGIAVPTAADGSAETVLSRADKALYTAKENGRDQVCAEGVDPA